METSQSKSRGATPTPKLAWSWREPWNWAQAAKSRVKPHGTGLGPPLPRNYVLELRNVSCELWLSSHFRESAFPNGFAQMSNFWQLFKKKKKKLLDLSQTWTLPVSLVERLPATFWVKPSQTFLLNRSQSMQRTVASWQMVQFYTCLFKSVQCFGVIFKLFYQEGSWFSPI